MGASSLVDHEPVQHRSLHHHHHHHNNNYRKPFLPTLCSSKPSAIKQLKLPKWEEERSASSSDDPLSPKIGCMGQVKRNNRVVGFPTPTKLFTINVSTTKANTNTNTTNFKYSKLKRLFSAKTLLVSNTATATSSPAAATTTGSCGRATRRKETGNACPRGSKKSCEKIENSVLVSLADMDPPLPVPKKVRKPDEGGGGNGSENLWRRRSGGVALKGLELQQIHHHHQCHHPEPDTV